MVHFTPRHFLLLVLCTVAVTSAQDPIRSIDVLDRPTSTTMTELPTLSMVKIPHSIFESARSVGVDNAEVKSSSTAIANVSVRANTTVSEGSTADPDAVRAFASTGAQTPSTLEPRPPNWTTLTTSSSAAARIVTHSQRKTLDDHALSPSTPNASASVTELPETETEAADSGSHAEPDASLEIAFLVLGALLALASVVIAIFFGYKQLSCMRIQTHTGRDDIHDSGSGVDLEIGPVVIPGDASDEVGAATDIADPNSQTS
jgi:hypothetical protein